MGPRPARATGAKSRACELGDEEAPRLPGQEPVGTPGLREVPEQSEVGLWSPGPSKMRKGGAGSAPQRLACTPGAGCGGLRGPEGGYGARLREPGGRDTHKFLGFAAVAARRRQLVRVPALLLVPGPATGPRAPAGRLHVQVRAASDPAPTPLPPGSSKPAAAAAQQLFSQPPRPASLACRAARAS